MPVIDLKSQDLWSKITEVLDANNEHVCVLPMTTFIKPVRTITIIQNDTSVTAARTDCPPGSVDLKAAPKPEPEANPEPEPAPDPTPDPTPEPEADAPRIVPYAEMQKYVTTWAFDDKLNAAYNRSAELDVRSSAHGVLYQGKLTVGMDWRDNPSQSVIVQVNVETGELLAHKRGSTRYYFNVNHAGDMNFEFVGQSGKDVIDIVAFGAS